jgi:transcriptional regulator with XRE-family HTH domain
MARYLIDNDRDFKRIIGQRLKNRREMLGLSRTDVRARTLNSCGDLKELEEGKRGCTFINMYHLVNALNMSFEDLLGERK